MKFGKDSRSYERIQVQNTRMNIDNAKPTQMNHWIYTCISIRCRSGGEVGLPYERGMLRNSPFRGHTGGACFSMEDGVSRVESVAYRL